VLNAFGADGRVEVTVRAGAVEVRSLLLHGGRTGEFELRHAGKRVPCTCEAVGDGVRVIAGRRLKLSAGQRLTLRPVAGATAGG